MTSRDWMFELTVGRFVAGGPTGGSGHEPVALGPAQRAGPVCLPEGCSEMPTNGAGRACR
jgi:hypothetical protein